MHTWLLLTYVRSEIKYKMKGDLASNFKIKGKGVKNSLYHSMQKSTYAQRDKDRVKLTFSIASQLQPYIKSNYYSGVIIAKGFYLKF
jgi:hypothetical protein